MVTFGHFGGFWGLGGDFDPILPISRRWIFWALFWSKNWKTEFECTSVYVFLTSFFRGAISVFQFWTQKLAIFGVFNSERHDFTFCQFRSFLDFPENSGKILVPEGFDPPNALHKGKSGQVDAMRGPVLTQIWEPEISHFGRISIFTF